MLPAVQEQGIAEFCDVFCEKGVFSAEESRRILLTGRQYGLLPKIHADEIEAIGGSELAGEIGAVSAEHLIVCPPSGIASMASGGTVACCLPATSFYLGAAYAPVQDMVQAGVPVAMATDFNPGSCPCLNMQLVINLGCLRYRLTPEQALTAVTLNGAAAICRADRIGSIEPGKQADHSHLEGRESGLYLLPPWQQSGRDGNQKRRRRLDTRTGNAHPDIACSARKLGFYAKSSLP